MARLYYAAPLGPLQAADGTAYASSVTITDVSPGGLAGAIIIPAGSLDLGTTIKMGAAFTASNTGTPTLLIGFYYGGVAGTALAATTAITTTTAMVNWKWEIYLEGVIQAVGTSGKFMPSRGEVHVPTSLTAFTSRPIPETALAQVTIDTTLQKIITLGATWGTSSASNTLTCKHMWVETLN